MTKRTRMDAGSRRREARRLVRHDGIGEAALAIKQGMTVTDLAETIFLYLTTVEGLKLAALAFVARFKLGLGGEVFTLAGTWL